MHYLLTTAVLSLSACAITLAASAEKHYLYLSTPDGAQSEGRSGNGILIFDIDHGHKFVKRIPTGGIGDEGPAPDVDGKRDTDVAYRQSVLRAKSQQSPSGQATTSYEPVDRRSLGD